MPDQAPEIKVKLTAEDTGVAAAIKALGTQLKELKTQSTDTAGGLGALTGAFDKLISAAVIYKLVEFGKEVFDASVNVERMSQKTGLSAGFLSVFGKAAEMSGASTEQVNISLGRLATNIVKFQDGSSKATTAFKALNLTQADFKGLSSDEKIRLVTDRLGEMHAGLQKAAIAQQLMGRGGQALLPTLDALAGEGFDKVTEAAKRSGQLLSDEMASDAVTAAAAFAELEGAGKGVATQFEAGLIPAITDVAIALTDSIEGDGVGAFRTLGEEAGMVLKGIILMFQTFFNLGAAIALSLYDVFRGPFLQIQNSFETLFSAAELSAHGHFAAAGKALADGVKKGTDIAKGEVDDLKSRWTAFGDLVTQNAAALFPSDEKKNKLRPKPIGPDTDPEPNNDKANKARLALLEARLQNELNLFKANNAAEESANQIAYDQGLEALQQYFEKRKALAQAESEQEIATLYAKQIALQKSPSDGTTAGDLAKRQKLETLQSQIDVARVQAATKRAQLDQQEQQQKLSLKEKELQFEEKIAAAQGKAFDAAEAHISIEVQRMAIILAQAGESTQQIDQKLAAYRAALEEQKNFKTTEDTGKADLAAIANKSEELRLENTDIVAKQKILALEAQRLPGLQQIAAQMMVLAKAADNPEQLKAAEDYGKAVAQIQANIQQAAVSWKNFDNQAQTAVAGDLSNFLGSTINQVHGIGDAFSQLASSAVSSIQRIVAQLLIQLAIQKLVQAASSFGFSGGGEVSSDFLPLAGGGLVMGPGSSTSDSINARLSDGEFVFRSAAVDFFGAHNLAAMNRGLTIPSIAGMSLPRFAEGGLVQSTNDGGSMDLQIGVGLDEGLVLRHLSSKGAGRVILQHLANNPKAASRAIARGQ